MSTKKIAGTCYIKVDGAQLSVEGSMEFPLTETNREARIGSTGVVGYSEIDRVPFLRCQCTLTQDFPIKSLRDSDDMTVTAEFANGWTYTLQGAWLAGEIDGNASDGNVTLEFNGSKGILET